MNEDKIIALKLKFYDTIIKCCEYHKDIYDYDDYQSNKDFLNDLIDVIDDTSQRIEGLYGDEVIHTFPWDNQEQTDARRNKGNNRRT